MNSGLGRYIDDFDLVIRINKCPLLVANTDFQKDIGSRTDVLFHCLNQEQSGKLDFEIYDKQQLKYIVSFTRRGEASSLNRWIMRFLKEQRNSLKNKLLLLPQADYDNMLKLYSSDVKRPTTGFIAIYAALQADFKELYITGMTFFQTNYISNYRDHIKTPELARKKFEKEKGHDPDEEFRLFKEIIKPKRDKIVLDAFLTEATAKVA
jgi:hypothetical protein